MNFPAATDLRRWSAEVARDPAAPAFVPLARAFRRQGRRDAALRICLRGLEHNPVYGAIHEVAARHFGGGYEPAFSFGDEAAMKQLLAAAKFMAVQVEVVSRLVRFPDAVRFVARSIESIAGNQGADPAKVPDAIAEANTAIAGWVTDNVLEMTTSSLIAIGRVSAK